MSTIYLYYNYSHLLHVVTVQLPSHNSSNTDTACKHSVNSYCFGNPSGTKKVLKIPGFK